MKKFRTVLLNGYQKSEVDAYINELEAQMEKLRSEGQEAGGLASRLEQEKEENARGRDRLSRQARELENAQERLLQLEKECGRLKEAAARQNEAEEKIRKYEKDYSDFMALMVNMKSQARQVVKEAQANAEQILQLAKNEADSIAAGARAEAEDLLKQAREESRSHRENVEKELEKKKEDEAMKFQTASFRLAGYLDSLNRSQGKLVKIYEELGQLVGQLPIKNSDVFSAKPFDFLAEPESEEEDKDAAMTESGDDPAKAEPESGPGDAGSVKIEPESADDSEME